MTMQQVIRRYDLLKPYNNVLPKNNEEKKKNKIALDIMQF